MDKQEEAKAGPLAIQEEIEQFIRWLYDNNYHIGWLGGFGESCIASEGERKEIVEEYLRGFKGNE